jgi:hypothetical protein
VAMTEAAKVRVLVPVVAVGLKVAVTPEGKPVTLRETLPVKPPVGEIVIPVEWKRWPLG